MFYNFVCTSIGLDRLINKLRSDYNSEIQNRKVNKYFTKQRITFEPFASYFQEENKVSDRTGRKIMNMIRVTILEGRIDNMLWPEIVLAMTHIKNLKPTQALRGFKSPIEM